MIRKEERRISGVDINFRNFRGALSIEMRSILKKSVLAHKYLCTFTIGNKNDAMTFVDTLIDDINSVSKLHTWIMFFEDIARDQASIDTIEVSLEKYNKKVGNTKDLYVKLIEIKVKYIDYFDEFRSHAINQLIADYERTGIGLSNDSAVILERLDREIVNLENSIDKYVFEHEKDVIELSTKDLETIPKAVLKSLAKVSKNVVFDIFRISINKANYDILMRYSGSSYLREKIETHCSGRYNNIAEYIQKLLVFRNKKAKLLGYNNFADYCLKGNMVKTSNNAKLFLTTVARKINETFMDDIKEITKYSPKICTWDIAYLTNKLKDDRLSDDSFIKEYFELRTTFMEVLSIYEELFDITFLEEQNDNVWHDGVVTYSVVANGHTIGTLFVDLIKRVDKKRQIKAYCLRKGTNDTLPITVLLGSFYKNCNNSILLLFHEVVSLFHEMGHVMFHIFSKAPSYEQPANDYVEIPAQVMDLYCWDKQIIRRLSSHYVTKNKLDDNTIDRMISIKNIGAGIHYKKQIVLAIFDQLVHSSETFIDSCENGLRNPASSSASLKNLMSDVFFNLNNEIMKDLDNPDNSNPIVYSCPMLPMEWVVSIHNHCRAYGPIWSRLLSLELFNHEKMRAKGGTRDFIVSFGNHVDPYLAVTQFLGHEPAFDGLNHCRETPDQTIPEFEIKISESVSCIDTVDDSLESISNKFSEYNESEN